MAACVEVKVIADPVVTLIPNVDYYVTLVDGDVVVVINKAGVTNADVEAKITRADFLKDGNSNVVNVASTATKQTAISSLAPTITAVAIVDATHITVTFSEKVDSATVVNGAFTVTTADGADDSTVTGVSLGADGKTVTITAAAANIATDDTVTVDATITDLLGNANSTTTAQTLQ